MYAKRRIFVCHVATSERELWRISLPRTRVNKGKKEGRGCSLLLGGATYNHAGTWERLGEEAECESWGNF
jgi:hypothetical protein